MTPQQINIAIVESVGWDARWAHYGNSPDYYHDLNAIHEVVCGLPTEKLRTYAGNVVQAVGTSCGWRLCDAINATAAQRCEAYLRAIGKWEDQ
jgi:hypothetical protein